MKKYFFGIAMLASVVRVNAVEGVDVQCVESFIDHGVILNITASPAAWIATAHLEQVTFSGTYPLGEFHTSRPHYPAGKTAGATLTYESKNEEFKLDLQLLSDAGEFDTEAAGTLRALVTSSGEAGVDTEVDERFWIEKSMSCRIYKNEP